MIKYTEITNSIIQIEYNINTNTNATNQYVNYEALDNKHNPTVPVPTTNLGKVISLRLVDSIHIS